MTFFSEIMDILSALLFGISTSPDALLLGAAYGIQGVRISLPRNLLISLITLFGTCLSIGLGVLLTPCLPARTADLSGSLVLVGIGGYYLGKSKQDRGEGCLPSAAISPALLTLRQTVLLSLALSVNNAGIGLSASMAGLSPLPALIATFLCSLLFLDGGNRLGRSSILRTAGWLAEPLSGVLLILLGICELF